MDGLTKWSDGILTCTGSLPRLTIHKPPTRPTRREKSQNHATSAMNLKEYIRVHAHSLTSYPHALTQVKRKHQILHAHTDRKKSAQKHTLPTHARARTHSTCKHAHAGIQTGMHAHTRTQHAKKKNHTSHAHTHKYIPCGSGFGICLPVTSSKNMADVSAVRKPLSLCHPIQLSTVYISLLSCKNIFK